VLAADVRARQTQVVPQKIAQQQAGSTKRGYARPLTVTVIGRRSAITTDVMSHADQA